jgi:hypothetical protein
MEWTLTRLQAVTDSGSIANAIPSSTSLSGSAVPLARLPDRKTACTSGVFFAHEMMVASCSLVSWCIGPYHSRNRARSCESARTTQIESHTNGA